MAFFSSKDLPNVRPVADFNFAATKVLDNRINFGRRTGATYADEMGIVRYAPHNVPRFDHNPATGECLGLLIEEGRINDARNSSDFSSTRSASGYGDKTTVNTNVTTAPDGTLTADQIVTVTTSTQNRLAQSHSVTNGSYYTYSIFIKYDNLDNVQFYLGYGGHLNTTASFTFSTETVSGGAGTAGFVKYPNGWYRIFFTGEAFSTGSAFSGFISGTTANLRVYVWGEQIEEGAFPTSYIPTGSSAMTRSEDRTVVKREKFKKIFDTGFNSFSVLIDYNNLSTDDGNNHGIFSMWGEETNYDNRIELFKNNTSPYHIATRGIGGGSGVFANGSPQGSDKSAVQKMAFSWSVPDYSNTTSRRWAFSFSGEDVDEIADGTGTSTPVLTRLGIGIGPTRLDMEAGLTHFKKIAIYNTVLTDEELKGLSAI